MMSGEFVRHYSEEQQERREQLIKAIDELNRLHRLQIQPLLDQLLQIEAMAALVYYPSPTERGVMMHIVPPVEKPQ